MPHFIAFLSRFTNLLPLSMLSTLFWSWPLAQVLVLRSFLHSPSAVFASLTMANDEMNTICDLDTTLLSENRHRIWMYFAEKDDWVGDQRENVLSAFGVDLESAKIVHGQGDIPHAFCIRELCVSLTSGWDNYSASTDHGEQLAAQCTEWLQSGHFL
jgi:hypothetical protein